MNRTSVGTETNAAAEAANRKQAECYRSLLVEHRDEIDRTIVEYLDEVKSGGRTEVESARELRHIVRKAERERQTIDRMIARIDERFPVMNRSGAPDQSPHGDGRPLVNMSQRRRSTVTSDRLYDQRVG